MFRWKKPITLTRLIKKNEEDGGGEQGRGNCNGN